MPVLREHRQKGFNWKTFMIYAILCLLILLLGLGAIYLEEEVAYLKILQSSWMLNSLTIIRLVAAVLYGVGVVRAIVAGLLLDQKKSIADRILSSS